jgi:hypothetical protein
MNKSSSRQSLLSSVYNCLNCRRKTASWLCCSVVATVKSGE